MSSLEIADETLKYIGNAIAEYHKAVDDMKQKGPGTLAWNELLHDRNLAAADIVGSMTFIFRDNGMEV